MEDERDLNPSLREMDISEPEMSIPQIVEYLKNHKKYGRNLPVVRYFPGNEGSFRPFPDDLEPIIREALRKKGIERLFSHQLEAWELLQEGKNVVIQTPTASGKTLAYNLPVLQEMLKNPGARALYLFPTKALSQDQVAELNDLIALMDREIRVFTFDGDTPQNARIAIRKRGNIVVTNPDMLHQGILPHHTKWMSFFQNIRYVVIDEIHAYRGVFGSHFSNLIRRLKRVFAFYGSSPLFICCSATIANPQAHAGALLEEEVALIDKSGAPQNEKYVLFYNPPVVNQQLGIRASYIKQTRNLARLLLTHGIQVIVFALSRLNVEVLTKYLKDEFERSPDAGSEAIAGYRGGYLPLRRREIERGLRKGKIKGVVATNALELGIDIGSLDAVIVAGYPGSIASTWQQFGRAGRRGDTSLAILIGRSNPLDQFLMNNAGFFFDRSPESARINPDNLMILVEHIKCAAFELPFSKNERFGKVTVEDTGEILRFLSEDGIVHLSGERWHWTSDVYPAVNVNLRRIPEGNFVVVDSRDRKKIIAEVDYSSAPMTIYPDAIYLADGKQYIVDELDWEGRKAYVRPTDSDYYTDAIDYTNVKILDVHESKHECRVDVEFGEVQVVTRTVGFKKIKFYTMENVGYGNINLPDLEFSTTSYWFTVSTGILDDLPFSLEENMSGIQGIAHAMQYVASLLLMCEPHDIHRCIGDKSAEWVIRRDAHGKGFIGFADEVEKGVASVSDLETFQPTIFLYDNYPGGVGFSQDLFDRHGELLEQTYRLIANCSCKEGCPACVGPVLEVGRKAKMAALEILRLLNMKTGG